MKKINLKLKTFTVVALIVSAVFAVSCIKEDVLITGQEFSAQDADLKNGRSLPPGTQSIATIAFANDGEFDELVAALHYVDEKLDAGLVDLFLNGTDQYTVFAPTDAAFKNLYGALGVERISDLHPNLVRTILLYHVTEGRRAANSVVPKNGTRTIETLLGKTFSVNTSGMISGIGNTAKIIRTNISASNGIIHVIDTVIMPILLVGVIV